MNQIMVLIAFLAFVLNNYNLININTNILQELFSLGSFIDWIHFNVETVIDCLRCSRNPQTHHHALILLNYAAKLYPVSYLKTLSSCIKLENLAVLRV